MNASDFFIAGVVVNQVTGAPLQRALVRITQTTTDNAVLSQSVLTDTSGAFRFSHLAAGAWQVSAERLGYQNLEFRPETHFITVGPASREDLRITLQPTTTIAGRVTDSEGFSVEGVVVQAVTGRLFRGRRDYQVASSTTTDDRGEYRLAGLYGGPFYVRAARTARWDTNGVGADGPSAGNRACSGDPNSAVARAGSARGLSVSADASVSHTRHDLRVMPGTSTRRCSCCVTRRIMGSGG